MNRDRTTSDPIAVAQRWMNQAGVLRRRAARLDGAERVEALARAEWFEKRARIVEASYPAPPIFPPELRTPIDRLDLVDDLRRHAYELLVLARSISNEELALFVDAVARARGNPALELNAADAQSTARTIAHVAEVLVEELGAYRAGDELVFAEYAVDLVDGDVELEAQAEAAPDADPSP